MVRPETRHKLLAHSMETTMAKTTPWDVKKPFAFYRDPVNILGVSFVDYNLDYYDLDL